MDVEPVRAIAQGGGDCDYWQIATWHAPATQAQWTQAAPPSIQTAHNCGSDPLQPAAVVQAIGTHLHSVGSNC